MRWYSFTQQVLLNDKSQIEIKTGGLKLRTRKNETGKFLGLVRAV